MNYIFKYIDIENSYLNCIISHYYWFYFIFDQIKAAMVSIREFSQKY